MRVRESSHRLSSPRLSPLPLAAVLALAAALAAAAVVLVRTAWLSDDAYISLRTVDNLVHGFGLVWNAGERVQAFTHPLWLLLLAAGRVLSGEHYFSTLALGAACSLLALALLGARCARTPAVGALAVVGLLFSRAFVDYATSGLENPLAYLLLALQALVVAREGATERRLALTTLIAALAVLTRPDLALLFAPGVLAAAAGLKLRSAVRPVLIGALPLLAWETFSLVYYGSLVPNTAYAKLGSGVPATELWARGAAYLLSSLRTDPLTPVAIAAGLAAGLRGDRCSKALGAGALFYLVFAASIGGDFMRGRFLAAPLFAAVIVLVRDRGAALRPALAAAALACLLGAAAPGVPALSGAGFGEDRAELCDEHGVCDERRFYYRATGLLRHRADQELPDSAYAAQGSAWRAGDRARTVAARYIGFLGFAAGPKVHIVDEHALADPLLARLPAVWDPEWRPGHFRRLVPAGYLESLSSGANRLRDPALAALHEDLQLVTRGGLLDPGRWRAIARVGFWRRDRLPDPERYRFPGLCRLPLAQAAAPAPVEIPADCDELTGVPTLGVRVELDGLRRDRTVSLMLRGSGERLVGFRKAGFVTAHRRVPVAAAIPGSPAGPVTIAVPDAAARSGYDTLLIVPYERGVPLAVWGLRFGGA